MPYETFVYDLISYLHSFRMLRLRHRVVVDESHLDVADHQQVHRQYLVHLIYKEKLLVRRQYVVENLNLLMVHLMQVVLHLDVLQILDEQNLDVNPPFLDEELRFPQVAAVDAEPHHQLKMDCYLDVVDAEPRYQLKMDCYLDEVQVQLALQVQHFRRRDRLPRALQPLLY
jgi:hypothetical protein